MKKNLLLILLVALCIPFVSSCHKEEIDYGSIVSGTYTGKLLYGTETIEDAYVVSVSRVSSTVASVYADFFEGSLSFNIEKGASGYNLVSETVYNVDITVYGKDITINYKTKGGYMFTFRGSKD